jgi:hypothetical protein
MDDAEARVKIVKEIGIIICIVVGMFILLFMWYNIHPIEFLIRFQTDNNTLELFKMMNLTMQNITVVR